MRRRSRPLEVDEQQHVRHLVTELFGTGTHAIQRSQDASGCVLRIVDLAEDDPLGAGATSRRAALTLALTKHGYRWVTVTAPHGGWVDVIVRQVRMGN